MSKSVDVNDFSLPKYDSSHVKKIVSFIAIIVYLLVQCVRIQNVLEITEISQSHSFILWLARL